MNTTLNAIRSHNPCTEGWKKLLAHLGKTTADDEPLSILTVLDSNGLDDAMWCLCAVEGREREIRLYAVWCARQVQHLMSDPRSVAALDVAERYANGAATRDELVSAWAAEWAAARAAWDAWAAARDAVRDAWDAWDAARAAAWAAAWAALYAAGAAAWEAARNAGDAAGAARDAGDAGDAAFAVARDAAFAAARDAALDAQERRLREICLQEVSA